MNRKSSSFFFLGVMTGVLLASLGYSWVQRRFIAERPVARVLKLAHTLDPKHPVHQAMVFMADRLREKSQGSMQLEIYPMGSWARSKNASNCYNRGL